MADEKLNPGQGEQIKLDISGESPAPDLTGEGPPVLEPGDVVVDTSKIDELNSSKQSPGIYPNAIRLGLGSAENNLTGTVL